MSNLLRTIQQVTRDYVDSISHRLPSIKNGTVTATSSDGTATVRVDGDTATTGSVPSIATVKTGDRVKMVLFNRQLTILGAIQRTDKLDADTIAGAEPNDLMRYLPDSPVASPIAGFDANTVDRWTPSLIPIYGGINTPSDAIAVLETIPYSPSWVAQYFHEMDATGEGRLFRRTFHSGTTWSAWEQLWDDGNVTYHGDASNGAVRYPNGVQIAWLAITTNTSITTAHGPAFFTTYTWTFATAFSSTPAVSCGRFQNGSSASWGMAAHTTTMNENTQALLRGMDFFSSPDRSTKISAIAVGRWK